MEIRFRPDPPDSIRGVNPVKDQGADREAWEKAKKKARKEGEEGGPDQKAGEEAASDKDGGQGSRKPAKDKTGHIVDVVI